MKPHPVHRLPAPIEAAVQSIKLAARAAVERTIESLGLAALAAGNVFQRDGLLGAQFELNRKSAVFVLTFNDAFDERVTREVAPRDAAQSAPKAPAWDALTLVEDHEVEVQISAERFGLETAQKCEWELRELDAYIGALLGANAGARERNPLRPEVVGDAMIRAVEAVSERPEVRKVLGAEMGWEAGALARQRRLLEHPVEELRERGARGRLERAAVRRLRAGLALHEAHGLPVGDIDRGQQLEHGRTVVLRLVEVVGPVLQRLVAHAPTLATRIPDGLTRPTHREPVVLCEFAE